MERCGFTGLAVALADCLPATLPSVRIAVVVSRSLSTDADSAMDTTPVTLLERLGTRGDEDAWRELVALVTPLLLTWARRVGLSREDGADLAQDVLAVLVSELPKFEYDPDRSFRAWLKTIAMNKWRERMRRARMRAVQSERHLEELPAPDAEAAWENEYRVQLVLRAFETIRGEFRPRTWQVCWELVVRGRDAADVCRQLDLSPDALYAAKYRVLHRLRKELDGMLD
jgi:RNA polymerase sigma-70 factor, ECF subfamily